MNDNKTEADLPAEKYFTVVYKLTDANTAKYLSNRDWVTYVYADSMAELASLKELSTEPAGAVYAELPNSLRTSDISGDPSDRHWASGGERQPIETAPKDGAYVLLIGARQQDVASGYWLQSAYNGVGAWIWLFVHKNPVGWAPLPASPTIEGESNG